MEFLLPFVSFAFLFAFARMAPSGDNQPHGKKEADEVGGGAKRL